LIAPALVTVVIVLSPTVIVPLNLIASLAVNDCAIHCLISYALTKVFCRYVCSETDPELAAAVCAVLDQNDVHPLPPKYVLAKSYAPLYGTSPLKPF
jgi:hypothetical protein